MPTAILDFMKYWGNGVMGCWGEHLYHTTSRSKGAKNLLGDVPRPRMAPSHYPITPIYLSSSKMRIAEAFLRCHARKKV